MTTILLALGSNLGDRIFHLTRARVLLAQQITISALSRVYETEPWGVVEQPPFLNQVLEADTALAPEALLGFVKRIEARMGRDLSGVRYGPRVIDIDILAYGDIRFESPRLQIPHPRLHERAFVLTPLHDIAPGWVHPGLAMSTAEMLARVDDSGVKPYHRVRSQQEEPLALAPQ